MNNANENTTAPVVANVDSTPANESVEQAAAPADAPVEPAADPSEPAKA